MTYWPSLKLKIVSVFKRDVIVQTANFLSMALVAAEIGPYLFGIWSILLLLPAYTEAFGRIKTDVAAVYFLRAGLLERREVVGVVNSIGLLSGGLAGLVVYAAKDPIIEALLPSENISGGVITLISASLPLIVFNSGVIYARLGVGDLHGYNSLQVVRSLSFFIMLVTMGLLSNLSIMLVASAFFLSYLLTFFYILYLQVHQGNILVFRWSKGTSSALLEYALPFYINGFISQISESLPRVAAARLFSFGVSGNFFAGEYLIKLIGKASSPLLALFYGELSGLSGSAAGRFTCVAFKVIGILSILIGLLVGLLFITLAPILESKGYAQAGIFAISLIPAFIMSSSCLVLFNYLYASGMASESTKVHFCGLIILAICIYFSPDSFGIYRLSLASNASAAGVFFLSISSFIHASGCNLTDLLPDRNDVAMIGRTLGLKKKENE